MALDAANLTNGTAVLLDTKIDADTGGSVITTYDALTFEIIGVENKDADNATTFKSVITADITGYSAAAEVAANADLLLTGDLANTDAEIVNTVAEIVSITSAGDDSAMFYDVTGENAEGEVVTERVAGANDGTAATQTAFLKVTTVTAVGDPAGTVSLAGEGFKEVVEQTETRKDTNDAGETVDVAFTVEKTINYDGGAKIKSGTEKIDGKEKTLGENGVVTAETMDKSLLGDAVSGDALAAVAERYDAVAANAEIYVEAENLGGGVTVTTLYDGDGLTVGSSDTSVETFGDTTYTVVNHFAAPVTSDAAGEYIGTSGTDGTNTWDYTEAKVTTDGVITRVETGSESYGGETRTFTYTFNESTGELISGSEVVDGITTTFGANWLITAETIDTSALGTALSSTVLAGLPASVKAATGDTFSKTETFEWGGGETTYFNAAGATLGFGYTWADAASGNSNNSFYDANGNYVGDSWMDGDRSGSSSLTYVNGKVTVETGSYADANNSGYDSSWTYNFNALGEMTGGSEVSGATTTTFGPNWSITGTQVAVTGLDTLNLDNLSTDIKTAFFTGMTTVYTSTETFDWGGSLMTYIHADGSILGYADSYSDDWDGDGTVDSTGVTYMNSDWSYVGSAWNDSWGTGERFETNKDADGVALASGLKREFGKDSWSDGAGGQEAREYDYTFDTSGQYWTLVSGTETGSDGVTTVYGADWSIISQKGDTSKLGDALTTAELVGVPTSIQSALPDAETYAKTTVYDWGTDTTYYDSTGVILGYANASSWDMDDGGSNTNKGYHDDNWNWLGGSWADIGADGVEIRSGSNSSVDIMTNNVKTGFTDTGSYREGNEGSTYSWTFAVTTDADGYENHAMTGGTEVRGTYNDLNVLIGTTYTYGADWMLVGAQADTSNLELLDLSTLDASLVTALFGSADAVIKFSTETFDWNQGFSQQTYYNTEGNIVGYGDSWSDDWDGDGVIDSTGQSYMDENWDYVGGSYSDDWDGDGVADSSGYNFTIKTVVNDVITQIQEVGENTWVDYEGNPQTTKYDFTYDGNWNLTLGTEERGQKDDNGVLSGGEKVTYGADWEVLSVSRDVNLLSEKIAELTVDDLAGIPTALHAATGKTYVETEVNSWGTQKTYLDSAGQILGYSDAWSDDWDGDGNVDSVGTSYQDADWNHLGSTYDDQWSTGFHHTVEGVLDGNKVYIETGSRTDKDVDGNLGMVTETNFIFDENWNMISGTETRGDTVDENGDLVGTTTVFGANWTIVSETTDAASLTPVDVSGLDAIVKNLLFAGEANLAAVNSDTEVFPWGGSMTTYFDAAGNILGYMDTYAEDYDGNGTIDSSGSSFMDANRDHIGGTYSDEWGSGSNFTVVNENAQTIAGIDYSGTRVESGTSSWTNHEGVVETRTFEYTYDLDYNLISGTETSSDETTTEYGLNWKVTGSSFSLDNLVPLSNAELLLLPTPLKAAVGETYSKFESWGAEGGQTTYIDAAGNILGYQDNWSYSDGNETFSGSAYLDANWNHFGGSNTVTVDGVVTSRSENTTIHSYDNITGALTGYVESGSNSYTQGGVVVTTSYTSSYDANDVMITGTEVREDGTTVKFGAGGAFAGEEISTDGLTSVSDAVFNILPDSIKGATAALTLFKITPNEPGYMTQVGVTQINTTFLSADGTVLGYSENTTADYDGDQLLDYVSSNFMDTNGQSVGRAGSDDSRMWSEVTASLSAGGHTETYSFTEKNENGQDLPSAGGTFTGRNSVTIREYDADDNLMGFSEIITLADGTKTQFVFDESYEIIGEYTYVLKEGGTAGSDLSEYDKVITDKYELFQLDKFIITDDYMKLFAQSQDAGVNLNANSFGIIEAFTADANGDGVADLTNSFGQSMIDSTVFAAAPQVDFIVPNDPSSGMKGLTFSANGLKMVWVGTFPYVDNPTDDGGIDNVASGMITEAYIFDTTNDTLVGYSDTVTMNFNDIRSFMDAQPEAPVYILGSAPSFAGTDAVEPDEVNGLPGQPAVTGNTYAAFIANEDMWEETLVTEAFYQVLQENTFDMSDTQIGAPITQAMINFALMLDPNYVDPNPAPVDLTAMLGGDAAFADLATDHGPADMQMGGEQYVDGFGRLVDFFDDGLGTFTETYTDPEDSNIQIQTTTAFGVVTQVELRTDPYTGLVTEVPMGSGQQVEGTFGNTVTSTIGGESVEAQNFNMGNVFTQTAFNSNSGQTTLTAIDARGFNTEFVGQSDGSFVDTTKSVDGNSSVVKTVSDSGAMIITQTKLNATGEPVLDGSGAPVMEVVGAGTSVITDGARFDTTVKLDGSKTELTVTDAGETLVSYTAAVGAEFLQALTMAGWGASGEATASTEPPVFIVEPGYFNSTSIIYTAHTADPHDGATTFVDIAFFEALVSSNWPLDNGEVDSTGGTPITTEMILAVGGVVPATPGTPGVVVTPNLPIIGAAVTAEMVTALVNAGISAEPTYTLESSNVTKTLENGATEQTATVGELEIVTTHTVQEDGALKSVIKTGDITLKETVTSRDAEGHETVVTRETLGKDHTKVTVSEGATTTTVTSTADGAVSKAVSETVIVAGEATIKTVTTNIAADETTVTVLEKIGDDAEVQTASGTMTVNANTMQQTYLLDNTDGTSDEIYLYRDGTEVKVSKDDQGNFTKAYDTYEYNDGTKWEKLEQDNVLTETYTKTNGETEVTTENLTTGQFTITTSTKVDGVLVEAITGTGVKTKVGEPGSEVTTHVITQTEGNVPTGVIETRVYDRSTGYETTTSARDGVTLGVVVEGWDDSGNQLTKTFAYVDGVLSTETEVTTSDNNTVETTTIGAANANGVRAVEVTQSGTDAAGKVFSKIVGTGTESTVGEETTKSVTLSDESVLTEKTNLQGSLIERIIEDAEGDKQKDTWVDGQKATVYLDDSDQILADGSTFEAVDIGLTSVANFDLTSIVDGPIQDDSEVGFFDFADNDLAVIVASGNDNTEEVQTATNVGNYGGNSNQISEETTVDSLNFAVFNDLLDDYQSLYSDVGGIA